MRAIPVFMYHHISWHAGDLVTLTPDDFEKHLQILSKKKIQTLFLDELFQYLQEGRRLPQPAVVLTFDDGYLDNWVYAYPLLEKYRMKATIFVITSWMTDGPKRECFREKGPRKILPEILKHGQAKERAAQGDFSFGLRWQEAKSMEASGLVDIQSHTHFHQDYSSKEEKQFRLDPEKRPLFLEDLALSRRLIEDRLNKKCRFLSWPWGKFDEQSVELAKDLGFEGLATTEKGVNYAGSSPLKIKRVVAKSGKSFWFSSRLMIYSHRRLGQMYSRVCGKI